MTTTAPLSPDDPTAREAAAAILRRHNAGEAEANITSAVRDFLIATRLASANEIEEENPPSDGSRRAVDLTALDTFVESKRHIGTARGFSPDPNYVKQLDDYLAESQKPGRLGILTDGKHWLLRWQGLGDVKTTPPYGFVLESADKWVLLYKWLRDQALVSLQNIEPTRTDIEKHFGINSPRYLQDIDALRTLYEGAQDNESIAVKRRLWQDLLRTALGEIAQDEAAMDDLFIRHTYLTTVIGIVVQASFGIDIRGLAESRPDDLVLGQKFRSDTGLEGVVESDFFAWPTEVGADAFLRQLARRIARFDWLKAPTDVAAILYETVIPPAERRQLGEYYTPHWLARAMVREIVTDPLNQRVLDPACGSGTFLAEAIAHFIETADNNPDPRDTYTASELLNNLRERVMGIDVHPVAVHLARAAWVLTAKPLFDRIHVEGGSLPSSNFSAPVYLGDSLQLRYGTGSVFTQDSVAIRIDEAGDKTLVFPMSIVDRAEDFEALIAHVTEAIEHGGNPFEALNDLALANNARAELEKTIGDLKQLHDEGRDHIWAYYTRNMVRPVALSKRKVDVIIGNPPWINYNKTVSDLRSGLEQLSKDTYGIWQGGRYSTHQDVAGLFYTLSVDLYLRVGGVIGMVMPHSALQAGQYAKWRKGRWKPVGKNGAELPIDFTYKSPWDLERLDPNDFFPVPASVVFAQKPDNHVRATPLTGSVERWIGNTGGDDVTRETVGITDTSGGRLSVYEHFTHEGTLLIPRRLVMVSLSESTTLFRPPGTVVVNPRNSSADKTPWRDLNLAEITGQTIESDYVWDAHLGETLVPYALRDPLKAVLPLKRSHKTLDRDAAGDGGVRTSSMDGRMLERWQTISRLWDSNKAAANKLSLIERIDYYGSLKSQIAWQHDHGRRPVRLVYAKSGVPTAAVLTDDDALIDHTLFWVGIRSVLEANYLLGIINSETLYKSVEPLMAKGQFGARHLHKHLWKLPIPEFDEAVPLHQDLAQAGEAAAAGVQVVLARLREEREDKLTVTIARREIRKWLRESKEGAEVERLVKKLLSP